MNVLVCLLPSAALSVITKRQKSQIYFEISKACILESGLTLVLE